MSKFKKKIGDALQSDRFSSTALTAFFLAIVVTLNVILYIIVEFFGLYFYSTEEADLTLSGSTDSLFASAIEEKKKVKISFCLTEEDLEGHSTGNYVYQTAKYYEERYPEFIELDFINLITRRNKNNELVDLSKYKTDMQGNDTPIYRSSVIFECGNNYRVMSDTYSAAGFAPFYTLNAEKVVTSYNGEEVIAAMISWVLADEHKTAYFTQYHGETAEIAFSNLLACAGYYVEIIDLRKKEVPSDADIVIISNPTSDFEASREGSGLRTEIDRLKTYVDGGGNLYVALDPYVKTLPVLEGFLAEQGIKFSVTETESGTKIRNMIKDARNAITTDGFTLVTEFAGNQTAKSISDRVSGYSDGRVIVREASALELSGNAKPILTASSASVLEAGGATVSRDGSYTVAAYSEIGNSKIFVVPSVFITASDSLITSGYSNKDFLYSLFQDFFGAGDMPYGCKAVLYDTETLENLTMGTAKLYTALIMLVPVAVAAVGAVIIVRRKNR